MAYDCRGVMNPLQQDRCFCPLSQLNSLHGRPKQFGLVNRQWLVFCVSVASHHNGGTEAASVEAKQMMLGHNATTSVAGLHNPDVISGSTSDIGCVRWLS